MRKILIFSLAYFPHIGGVEVAVKEITDRIHDIEFHLITLHFGDAPRRERLGNVEVYRVGWGGAYVSKVLFAPLAALEALRLHRKHHFDAMWAMMSYMLFPIVLTRVFGVRVPYVVTLQEGDTEEYMFGRLRILPFLPILWHGFRHASVITALSRYLAEWAGHMGYRGKVMIIPNGADTEKFAGTKTPHGGVVLVTSSRLVHKNAVDDVIRALALLPENVIFVVAGIGPEEAILKRLAREQRVESRVVWKGHVNHAALPALLHAADIFVRPSRSEGMGASFPEAMAAGLPIIATQEGGIADFLFDSRRNPDKDPTGFAVEKDSPEQIAESVRHILMYPEEAARVVANAQKLVREKYDWDKIARAMREEAFAHTLGN